MVIALLVQMTDLALLYLYLTLTTFQYWSTALRSVARRKWSEIWPLFGLFRPRDTCRFSRIGLTCQEPSYNAIVYKWIYWQVHLV